MKKIIFFLKNPGIHEKMDVFWMNLRGYPTISQEQQLQPLQACSAERGVREYP